MTVEERFWSNVIKTETCWFWICGTMGKGYVYFDSGEETADRFSYALAKGKIPDGLEIEHLCKVINCVNPEHLEAHGLGPAPV